MVAANGTSKLASDYGAWIMRQLGCFNTVKVTQGCDIES